MARGFPFCSQTRTTSFLLRTPIISVSLSSFRCHKPFNFLQIGYHGPRFLRFFCNCVLTQEPIDVAQYKESFSRRMAMAGLKPHHRIAIGVSGGPDSMALCVLAADWKTNAVGKTNDFIDGLLGIVVDHGLRPESKDEANVVRSRVSDMGIRCEIACCDWVDGRPKVGHLQEAAREMRYHTLERVCTQHQIAVLLIAHHADDQTELFILRLSRNSGVLGLAGTAFTSQIFSPRRHSLNENAKNYGILVVRPLLDFCKEDLYEICQWANQNWVEDPTNRNQVFARNRIRMSVGNLPSSIFKIELQEVISACRKTRVYVDYMCYNMINQAVAINEKHGYAVVDLDRLDPSKVLDICLLKFVGLILQFISQRQRPIRGSTSKLLLDYIRTIPCKTSLTAAGCYLCPAPGSKGSKILVCCSVNCPLPSNKELFYAHSNEEEMYQISNDLEQIILEGKSLSSRMVPHESEVHFLDVRSDSILTEAKKLKMLSESTYMNILSLQIEETSRFKYKPEATSNTERKPEVEDASTSSSKQLQSGKKYHVMDRFLITWKMSSRSKESVNHKLDSSEEIQLDRCISCVIGHGMVVEVRHMMEADWLYLAKFSKSEISKDSGAGDSLKKTTHSCLDYARMSAGKALSALKSIPVAARRSLPVLVNHHGLLLSVPSIGFKHCRCMLVSAEFKPRVPLGGGHSCFI